MSSIWNFFETMIRTNEPEMDIGLPVDVWRPIHVEATKNGLVGLPQDFQVKKSTLTKSWANLFLMHFLVVRCT